MVRTASRRSTLLALPDKPLMMIIAYTMISKVPLDLGKFIELGERHQNIRPALRNPSDNFRTWFLDSLPIIQRKHYIDWLAINTSRRFRKVGKHVFFFLKTFMIAPPLLKALLDGSCKNMAVHDRMTLFRLAGHVIAHLPATEDGEHHRHHTKISIYNAFIALKVLSIQPFLRDCDILYLRWAKRSLVERLEDPDNTQPVRRSDLESLQLEIRQKRHPAPPPLQGTLRSVGLEVGRMKVDLIYPDTYGAKYYAWGTIASQVCPSFYEYAKKSRAEEARKSQASAKSQG